METVTQEILDLVRKKMKEQAAYDKDSFRDLVNETVIYFKERGKISDEENEKFIIENVMRNYDRLTLKATDEF